MALALTFLLSSLVGVLVIPALSRQLSEAEFSYALLLLMINSGLRWFDAIRPVFTQQFSSVSNELGERGYKVRQACVISFFYSVPLSFGGYILFDSVWSEQLALIDKFFLSLSFFIYFMYSPAWAVWEAEGNAPRAQFFYVFSYSSVYIAFSLLALLGVSVSLYSFVILASHLFCFSLLWLSVLGKVDFFGEGGESSSKHVFQTLISNFFKFGADYGDRSVVSNKMPASFQSSYLALYEVLSRINIIPAYLNVYMYPKLCLKYRNGGDARSISRYIALSLANYFSFYILSLLFFYWGEAAVELYFGKAVQDGVVVGGVLLLAFSLYSIAFYAQSVLRALKCFSVCMRAYFFSFLGGFLFLGWFYFSGRSEFVYLAVLSMKFSGVLMMASILMFFSLWGLCVFFVVLIVASLIFYGYLLGFSFFLSFLQISMAVFLLFAQLICDKVLWSKGEVGRGE